MTDPSFELVEDAHGIVGDEKHVTVNDMEAETYFGLDALSHGGMKDLAISPLRYWAKHVDPEREKEEPTPAMQLGTALHYAVLQPDKFAEKYAKGITAADYPGCLITMDDLRAWLRDKGITPKGTRKGDAIAQVQACPGAPPILDVIAAAFLTENAGKTILDQKDWQAVTGMATSLRQEPIVQRLLSEGAPEVSMFARDPGTGVLLKARMDWVATAYTLDLKTFTAQRSSQSIDQAVAHAIFWERYYRQAYTYSLIRAMQTGGNAQKAPEFILAFVESEKPHDVRLRSLRPKTSGEVNIYWEKARIEVRNLIDLYADCRQRFGLKPWRDVRQVEPLSDEELPAAVNY